MECNTASSNEGDEQGDPLMPLLFKLAIHDVASLPAWVSAASRGRKPHTGRLGPTPCPAVAEHVEHATTHVKGVWPSSMTPAVGWTGKGSGGDPVGQSCGRSRLVVLECERRDCELVFRAAVAQPIVRRCVVNHHFVIGHGLLALRSACRGRHVVDCVPPLWPRP